MAIQIITTVGTSVFTNFTSEKAEAYIELDNFGDFKDLIKDLSRNKTTPSKDEETTLIDTVFDKFVLGVKKGKDDNDDIIWEANPDRLNINCCAEIQTIEAIAKKTEFAGQDFHIHLLTTETVLSKLAAKIIKKAYEGNARIKVVAIKKVIGLQVENPDRFDEIGFENLVSGIRDIQNKKDITILNISGGYKGVVPIATILGQIYGINLNYIYEDTERLIEIGNLPIHFDWARTESLKPFLGVEYHDIWQKENGIEIAKLLAKGDIFWNNDTKSFKIKEGEEIPTEYIKDKNRLLIFKELFDKKLISKGISLTSFGRLFQSIQQIENYRGLEMEYIFAHHFHKKRKDVCVADYYTIPSDSYKIAGSFKVINGSIEVRDEAQGNNNTFRDIGDIDITLTRKGINVLGEAKSFGKIRDYVGEKGDKGDKYLQQLKARLIQFCKQNPSTIDLANPSIEILLIIYEFQVKDYALSIKERQDVKDVFAKFKDIENLTLEIYQNGEKITVKPIFNIITAQCLVNFDYEKQSINYDGFYKNPEFCWDIIE
jgi:putative CRISPR-associated protein (TIGR02619 family)